MKEAATPARVVSPSQQAFTVRFASIFWGALGLLLCAQCTSIERATRVAITLDAEPELRTRIAHVDLAFYAAISPDAFRMRAQERLRPEGARAWPLQWSFARSDDRDLRYSLEAEALDADGKTLAELRAVGMFRDQQTLQLQLRFDTSCTETCGDGQTCRDRACVDAEVATQMSMVGSTSPSPTTDAGGSDGGTADKCSADAASCSDECGPDHGGCDPQASCKLERGKARCGDCNAGFTRGNDSHCSPLLRDLTVDGAALEPSFRPEVTDYTLTTGLIANHWRLKPVAAGSATITLNGAPLASDITPQLVAASATELVIEVATPQSPPRQYKIALRAVGRELSVVKAGTPTPDAHFGHKVVLVGDTLIATAINDASSARGIDPDDPPRDGAAKSGSAYVLRRHGADWQQEAYIKASDTSKDAEFGKSAALQGDTLVIGAWKEADQGAVYVYQRQGTSWRELMKITAEPRQNGSNFGQSVALLGDVLAIGAGAHDLTANDTGAVYIYRRKPDQSWSFDRIVAPDTLSTLSWFGSSVFLTNDYLVVGATGEGNGTLAGGAAYVFRADSFELIDMLKPSSAKTVGFFGEHTAVVGDTVVISSFNNNAGLSSGSVYVYARQPDGKFQQKATLEASNASSGDQFGTGLALTADYLLVGAAHENSGAIGINGSLKGSSLDNSGAAYLFARSGATGFRQVAHIKASEPASGAQFGYDVAIDGSDIAITADSDGRAANGSGAVYLFR